MRYFKYKNTDKTMNNALKEQYKTLTKDEKRLFRKQNCLRKFSAAVTLIIFLSFIAVGILLIRAIPQPDSWFFQLLAVIGKAVIGFVMLIISGILTAGLTAPLWIKAESLNLHEMKKEIPSKACGHLRDYYGLREPYIITKCFDSTDKKFQNHDVCIFTIGDELRLTTDLVNGFLYSERDLGCYAFKRKEITLSKQKNGNQLVAELKADNITFMLGYRAKGFIDKNFISKPTD